jgi:hypothetical protein
MLEQALRSSNQRVISVVQTHREVSLGGASRINALRSRVYALEKKLGVKARKPVTA